MKTDFFKETKTMTNIKEDTDRKPWQSPRVAVLGDIESITQGNADGESLDADFPVHTKKSDLGFS